MDGIIKETFEKWTNGMTLREASISIFEHIRDIPYVIDLRLFDVRNGLESMLKKGKGFCVPKHYLLGMMFEELGIHVRYLSCSFRWDELNVLYPDFLRAAAKNLPITRHLACKAYIENKWILIDATWDKGLRKIGFPVNETWDGKKNMKNAVKPVDETVETMETEEKEPYRFSEKLKLFRFSAMFNKWLDDVRRG